MSPSPIPLLIHLIHLQDMYVKYMRLKILFLVCRSGTPQVAAKRFGEPRPPLQMLKYERFYANNFGKNMNEKKRSIGMVSPWRGENDEWK